MDSGWLAERCIGRCPELFEQSRQRIQRENVRTVIEAKRHFVHVHPLNWKKGIESTSCVPVVIKRPQAMEPEGPSGCGAIKMSK